jgi:hypothetical protein
MRVIKPTVLTSAMLISSTVPETDHAAYAAGTTYALGARVIRTSTHRIYESLQDANTGHTPETEKTWWSDVGPTNRWAMFDTEINTQTVGADGVLTVVIQPGPINSLALIGMDATGLTITMVDGVGATVYSRTVDLDNTQIVDFYTYCFEPRDFLREVVLTDIPVYGAGQITITLTSGSTPRLGALIFGSAIEIGDTKYGAQLGIVDYSKIETDEFGTTTFIRRNNAKRINVPILLSNSRLRYVSKKLQELTATPCVWIGSAEYNFSPLITFGFFQDFGVTISYANHSECNLEIRSMI